MKLSNLVSDSGSFIKALLMIATVIHVPGAYADEGTGFRKILDLGCDNRAGICTVLLDGAPFGAASGCIVTNEFRFDNGGSALGRLSFGSLLAAYLAQKRVLVVVNGCTSQGAPALAYFHISD